jgi:glycosyltransferase involved in cell wall biosynthesis
LRAVHQFVPRLEPGAVGAHALEAQRILQAMGHASEIYADGTDPAWAGLALPYQDYGKQARPGDVLLYQAAVGSVVADYLLDRREPLIVNYHNVTPARFFRAWDQGVVHAVTVGARQVRRLAARAVEGIAVSAYNERELRDVGYRRTSVAPVLFDVAAMRNEIDAGALRRLTAAKEDGGADLLFVGRVAPNKAHHDLVKAFAVYREAYDPTARLHLVGGGAAPQYSSALERFVAALGLHDAVRFTGPVSTGELAAHYATADAFVCLSEHEGFCVPLVEAMANDVPVVAFAAAAVPETLAGAGLLLEHKDPVTVATAVRRVVTDAPLRAQLVDAGRTRLADLSLDHLQRRFRAAVRDVIARLDEDDGA